MQKQLAAHDEWVKSTVLAHARADFRLPPEVYASNLKQVGLDISPQELIKKADLEFMETRAQMQVLASTVAKEHGIASADYREVLKALKKQQLDKDSIEPYYHDVIGKIETIIREQNIVTLPQRAMIMRLASEAESASQPAPHMDPPPLINNHGERGTFVLPLGNPPTGDGNSEVYDDFTCKACAWTLTAHEGRPGHELQFSAMVEHGVSLARSLFAFNSVNVEGWALYSEFMMVPYEPSDGQMIALQLRLLRAARAMLDPMLNLGMISRDRAHDIFVNDVGLSEAFAREELDRFTFRSPGQATAYFYGYARLLELRANSRSRFGQQVRSEGVERFYFKPGIAAAGSVDRCGRSGFLEEEVMLPKRRPHRGAAAVVIAKLFLRRAVRQFFAVAVDVRRGVLDRVVDGFVCGVGVLLAVGALEHFPHCRIGACAVVRPRFVRGYQNIIGCILVGTANFIHCVFERPLRFLRGCRNLFDAVGKRGIRLEATVQREICDADKRGFGILVFRHTA